VAGSASGTHAHSRSADARSAGYAGDPNVPMGVLVGTIGEMKALVAVLDL